MKKRKRKEDFESEERVGATNKTANGPRKALKGQNATTGTPIRKSTTQKA